MFRTCVILAATFGLLAVVAGTFGAHGLETRLNAHDLETWNTATRYQMYHALALLGLASLRVCCGNLVAWLFVAGIVFFCGSLYLLAVSEWITGERMRWLGTIAPLGGVSFMLGWVTLLVGAIKYKASNEVHHGHGDESRRL